MHSVKITDYYDFFVTVSHSYYLINKTDRSKIREEIESFLVYPKRHINVILNPDWYIDSTVEFISEEKFLIFLMRYS